MRFDRVFRAVLGYEAKVRTTSLALAAVLAVAVPRVPLAQGPEVQDFNFYNTDISLVLKALAEVTGVEFVEDVPISGKVTIHVAKRAPLEEVLETILKPLGLTWQAVGNVFHIGLKPGERAARDRPGYVQKTFALKNISAGEAGRLLRKSLRARGIVSVDRPMNQVTVTVAPALLPEMENIIKAADVQRSRKLVAVRVKIMEIVKTKDFDSEVSWEFHKYNATWTVANNPTNYAYRLSTDRGSFDNSYYNNALTYKFGLYGIDQVAARLRLQVTTDQLETLSEEDVILLEGKEATITINEKVPNDKQSKYQDIGTILIIKKPEVTSDGFIKFEVETTMARRKNVNDTSIWGAQLNRYIKTKVNVLNGDTARLGGLISQTEDVREDKMPLLGDLPLLGFLFKRYRLDTERKELVMLISPSIVEDVPPHGRRTPGITALAVWLVPGTTHAVLDWSEDIPVDNVGIFQYRVYRDLKPVTSVAGLTPVASDVPRAASSWVDETPKRRGATYYYAVTALDGAGNQQAVSNSPAITIPKR